MKEKDRERKTRIKRWTYTPTMSDNTADHYYRYSRRKRETNNIQRQTMNQNISENWYRHTARKRNKEIRMKRRTYTRKIKKERYYSAITRWAASLFTYMQREKKRERNVDRETFLYTYN